MSLPFLLGTDYLRKIQSVRPESLVSLWPQDEPLGHGVSTEIVRGYDGAYTAVTLGQPGVPGSGLTSAGYDGAASFNNIYSAGFANDNLMGDNGGFETAGAMPPTWLGWVDTVGDGAIANEVVIVHEGNDSAKLTAGPSANTFIVRAFNVTPGVRSRLRLWTRGDGVNDTRYQVQGNIDPWPSIIPITNSGVTAAAWGMVAIEFVPPAGQTQVVLRLWCPAVNGGVGYFDAGEVRTMEGFLGDQGTVIIPAQVANVGVWTDGIGRRMFRMGVGPNNYIDIAKTAPNNTVQFLYVAGGVIEQQATAGLANIDFAYYGITWDISAGATGEVMYYIDGVASGATDVALGTWVGNLLNTDTVIGAGTTVPASVWSGNIGPVPTWSDALSPDEMRYLG